MANIIVPDKFQKPILKWVKVGKGGAFIDAGPGSGKSTTIELAVEEIPANQKILILAFNSHIKDEMRDRMGRFLNVEVMTFNGLGWRLIYQEFGKVSFVKWKTQNILQKMVSKEKFQKLKRPIDSMVNLLRSLNEIDTSRAMEHAAFYGIELGEIKPSDDFENTLANVFKTSIETVDYMDFADQVYQPIYRNLSIPEYDWIFVDESQDASPLNIEMVTRLQQAKFGRCLLVGDPQQCQPAGTMISIMSHGNLIERTIETVKKYDEVVSIQKSTREWRINSILEVASRPYVGPLIRVTTLQGLTSRYTPNHRCFADFSLLRHQWCVYVMRRGNNFRIGKVAMAHGKRGICSGLAARMRTENASDGWILDVFGSSQEAYIQEQIISAKFNIPQTTFKPSNSSQLVKAQLDEIWDEIGDNTDQTIRCLEYYNRDIKYPIITGELRDWSAGLNRLMEVRACNLMDGCCVVPLDWQPRRKVDTIHNRAKRSDFQPIRVKREHYIGEVYSLKVSRDEIYVADQIACGNSVYLFRGAHPKAMEVLQKNLNAKMMPLYICYRLPNLHIEYARKIAPKMEAPVPNPRGDGILELDVKTSQFVKDVMPGDFVLCRCVAPLVKRCMQQLRMGKRAFVKGRDIADSLIELVERIHGNPKFLQEQYFDWTNGRKPVESDLPDFVEKLREYGRDRVRSLVAQNFETEAGAIEDRVQTIEFLAQDSDFVVELIVKAENIMTDEDEKNAIIFMTGHKAKGLEGERIWQIRPDLVPHPRAKTEVQIGQEWNLELVMRTRSTREYRTVLKERGEK